jgi:Sulfotransferase family
MKTPLHLGELPTLLETFPGALVVHCHRDPAQAIPSAASLVESARRVRSDDVDPLEVGSEMLGRFSSLIERALEARQSLPVDSFIDLSFRAIVSDVKAAPSSSMPCSAPCRSGPGCRPDSARLWRARTTPFTSGSADRSARAPSPAW